ncbi:cytochrome c oxidase subunit II [Variovorax sp. VNK109]|uniref:cytochrome c oxidase subunit II n=1 Tax=Variovorax sp. VNK109 TaxID=3400919 RepID=UPI003C02DA99
MNGHVLQTAGDAAHQIATVSWVLFIGGGLIFIGVMALLAWALFRRSETTRPMVWLALGGVAFPAVVLSMLFAWSLPMSPLWKPVPPPDALIITVTGRMWWWDVRYGAAGDAPAFDTANEIRIPVGRPVYLALTSGDVIHSFWVPALAGKVDMLPGRIQHLQVRATQAGTFRGQCAEYCGIQHARMALHVVAEPPEVFDAWRRTQTKPAAAPVTAQQLRGRELFLAQRCNACHTVRGVASGSRLGPDLTHVGSRLHLAAGTLPNSVSSLSQWVAHVQDVKPGARMPSYARLERQQLDDLGVWLESLK